MVKSVKKILFAIALLLLFAHTFLPHHHIAERLEVVFKKPEQAKIPFWVLFKKTISENLGYKHLENFTKSESQNHTYDIFGIENTFFYDFKLYHNKKQLPSNYTSLIYNSVNNCFFNNRAPPNCS